MRLTAWSLGIVALVTLAIGAPALGVGPANAQDKDKRVKWKMQSAFGSQLPHIGTSGVRFTKNIETLSDGRFEIKFFEPGALVPPLECFDAVSKGSIEACWTTPAIIPASIRRSPSSPPCRSVRRSASSSGGNGSRRQPAAR